MISQSLNSYVRALSELFFPRVCYGCGKHLAEHEREVCSSCLRNLPRTGFELVMDNFVSKMLWGRVEIEKAASLYYYRKGELLQKLLHGMKYRGNYRIGEIFGMQIGNTFSRAGFFSDIDVVIPVPLNTIKQRERGYNQSEHIAAGISASAGLPLMTNNLVRDIHTESQTHKGRFERWENVRSAFSVLRPEELQGMHVLLVDDVITTGATLEACAAALKAPGDVRVSIATVGVADI
jgi:ComF family protein